MEELFEKSSMIINNVDETFKRYLLNEVRWNNRLIALTGARGCGKTTLLLQYAKQSGLRSDEILYISLDDLSLMQSNIVSIASAFYKSGGKLLLLDEVHKYPNWSLAIKNIYDTYPALNVAFTGSSVLEIYKAEADLSRRAIQYNLHNLSLREYIAIKEGIVFPVWSLSEILSNHTKIASEINAKIRPLKYFNEYLTQGAFPYFREDSFTYHQRLLNTIHLTIETDLPTITAIDFQAIVKIKQLVAIIAESVPFKPNILKLSERLGIKRDTLLKYLHLLDKARILSLLYSSAPGIGQLTKPEKIYLQNPNLMATLVHDKSKVGTLRETFFLNQLLQTHTLTYTEKGDFVADDKYTFEVGGANKTNAQIKDVKSAYIVKDDIEFGARNTIPIWMFGFMF